VGARTAIPTSKKNKMTIQKKTKPIRVILLGFGLSGKLIHFPLILANPYFKLIGVLKRNIEDFEYDRTDYKGLTIYDSIDRVILDSYKFDLAIIATPNITHMSYANLLMNEGIDVVIEKPIAGNERETREIFDQANLLNRHIFAFQNRRWDSDFLTLKKILQMETVGHIISVESNWENFKEAKNTWRNSANIDDLGGILLDLGPHLIDQMIQLLGPIDKLLAEIKIIRPNANTDDEIRIEMLHRSGVKSIIAASHFKKRASPRFRVKGSKGELYINDYDTQEIELRSALTSNSKTKKRRKSRSVATFKDIDGSGIKQMPGEFGDWQQFYMHVASTLLHKENFPIKPNEIIINSQTIDFAKISSKNKSYIKI